MIDSKQPDDITFTYVIGLLSIEKSLFADEFNKHILMFKKMFTNKPNHLHSLLKILIERRFIKPIKNGFNDTTVINLTSDNNPGMNLNYGFITSPDNSGQQVIQVVQQTVDPGQTLIKNMTYDMERFLEIFVTLINNGYEMKMLNIEDKEVTKEG